MNNDELLHVSDFFVTILRRKAVFLGTWVLIIALAVAYLMFAPKSYQLTGTVYVGRLQHKLLEEGEFVGKKLQDYSFVERALTKAGVDPGKPISRLILDIKTEVVNEVKKDDDVGIVELTLEAKTPQLCLDIFKAITDQLISDHAAQLATGTVVFKDMEKQFWEDEKHLRASLEYDEEVAAKATKELAKDGIPTFLLLGHTIAEKRSNHQVLIKDIHYLRLEGDSPTDSFNTRLAAVPVLPDEPFKPKPVLIMILAVILATIGAASAALGLEFYEREVKPRI